MTAVAVLLSKCESPEYWAVIELEPMRKHDRERGLAIATAAVPSDDAVIEELDCARGRARARAGHGDRPR